MDLTVYKPKASENIMFNENGGISPLGYIDIPTSNGQQIISKQDPSLLSSSSHSNNAQTNSVKMGQTRLNNGIKITSITARPILSTTIGDNFSGNLAARLNANRNKNRKPTGDHSNNGSVEPLIINLQTTLSPSLRRTARPMTTSTTRS